MSFSGPRVVILKGQSINLGSVIHVQDMIELYDEAGRLLAQDIGTDVEEVKRMLPIAPVNLQNAVVSSRKILLVRMAHGWQWPLKDQEDIDTFLRWWEEFAVNSLEPIGG